MKRENRPLVISVIALLVAIAAPAYNITLIGTPTTWSHLFLNAIALAGAAVCGYSFHLYRQRKRFRIRYH